MVLTWQVVWGVKIRRKTCRGGEKRKKGIRRSETQNRQPEMQINVGDAIETKLLTTPEQLPKPRRARRPLYRL